MTMTYEDTTNIALAIVYGGIGLVALPTLIMIGAVVLKVTLLAVIVLKLVILSPLLIYRGIKGTAGQHGPKGTPLTMRMFEAIHVDEICDAMGELNVIIAEGLFKIAIMLTAAKAIEQLNQIEKNTRK